MCFKRKPSLGRYKASRREWVMAYRFARIDARNGREPDAAFDGVRWKAGLIVAYERDGIDLLDIPVTGRIASKRLINEILAEAN